MPKTKPNAVNATDHSSPLSEPKPILTVDEVVALTGYSKHYVYKLVHTRKIPYSKTLSGRKLFFKRSRIIEWLTANSPKTMDEILNNKTTKNEKTF